MYFFLFGLLFCLLVHRQLAVAQTPVPQLAAARPDTAALRADTTGTDSLAVNLNRKKGDINTTIKYSARDSIRMNVRTNVVHLYGDAKINYGDITLEAAYIEINWKTNILTATSVADSAGKEYGIPVFKEGADMYTAHRIAYNFKTRKGRIERVLTQQGEGYIHGETVKKTADNELYIRHAQYTTCNLAHPHFYINAGKIKMIPNDRVVTGPFNMVIEDVPTPLGLPFGLFPIPKKRASGMIIPSYGETRQRGFFLRNGGFYWAVNDYIGSRITGDIYSLGGFRLQMDNAYIKRYHYNGNFNLSYAVTPSASVIQQEGVPPTTSTLRDIWVRWNHAPVVHDGGTFSANVEAGSTRFLPNNARNVINTAPVAFNSAVTYQRNIRNTPFSYSIAARQDQNNSTGAMNFTLPDVSINMARISPFARKTAPGRSWYEQIGVSYSFTGQNRLSNQVNARIRDKQSPGNLKDTTLVLDINSDNLSRIIDHGQRSASHIIPVTANFKAFRYFTVTPNLTYNEVWQFEKLTFRPEQNLIGADTAAGFYAIRSYSAGLNTNTRAYGLYYVRGKKLEAIRHMVSPNFGFSYRPSYKDNTNYYQAITTEENGKIRTDYRSRFLGASPGLEEQANLNFSLTNNLEGKVKGKVDSTTGKPAFEKIRLIDNLGLNTAYNLAADSFQLQNIALNFRTLLFKKLDLNLNANYDPYGINEFGRRINALRSPRLTTASLVTSLSLNPETRKKREQLAGTTPTTPGEEALLRDMYNNPQLYVDFTIPWSLNVSYNLTYFRNFQRFTGDAGTDGRGRLRSDFQNVLNFSGDLRLTDKWKIGFFSGYDFKEKGFSNITNLTIYRDLHCWEMNFTWVPIGAYQSYSFSISGKASLLQDLKFQRNKTWYDR